MDYYVSDAQSLAEAFLQQAENPESDTIYITADIDLSDFETDSSGYFFEFGVGRNDTLIVNGLGNSLVGSGNGGLVRIIDGSVFIGNLTLQAGALVGADGIDRAQAASGASHVITGGENGQAGESGGVGGSALGAGLSISSGASVSLSNVSFLGNVARGGDGGDGGEGGNGGESDLWRGGRGGDGGNGGEGGAGIGAIFNAGILRLDNVTFDSNLGIGGLGGQPGYGGLGGPSGIGADGPYGAVGLLGEQGFSRDDMYSVGQDYQDDALAAVNDLFALYKALLGRTPDAQGLTYWKGILDSQVSLAVIAQDFIDSYEYEIKTNASESEIEYLRKLYINVLERVPEQEAQNEWVKSYEAGLLTRAELAANVAQSDEAQQQISGNIAMNEANFAGNDLAIQAVMALRADPVATEYSQNWLAA